MLKSYWKTAVRSLLKNKTYGFINIFGLAAGTFCCLYILLYVRDQYSYDRHHVEGDDIYRVNRRDRGKDGVEYNVAITAMQAGPVMKRDLPEVRQFTRVIPFIGVDKNLVSYREKHLWIKDAFIVDSTFFDVFTYRPVRGDLKTALDKPNTAVLLKPLAEALFGNDDPVGKTITLDNTDQNNVAYTVTAVVEEAGKSHLHGELFTALDSKGMGQRFMNWDSWVSETFMSNYVKLQPHTDVAALERKLPAVEDKYASQDLKKWGVHERLYLQPIASIHTTAGLDNNGIGTPVDPTFLSTLVLIAVLIQVIACINFMNLATARASKRAREVGVRKVIGAGRGDLLRQFLAESFLLALAGVSIALPLLLLALPWLNGITNATVTLSFLKDYHTWIMLGGLVVFTGLIAGSYPAFYLSAFSVVRVLKGQLTNRISIGGIRRMLVVVQFVLSIVLISGIVVIYNQLNYIRNKDLGFNKDQRLLFTFNSTGAFNGLGDFMNDLRSLAGVEEVSNASKPLATYYIFNNSWSLPGKDISQSQNAEYVLADRYFVKANGIRLVSGRDFREGDSDRVLINETFARQLGLTAATAPGVRLHDSQDREVEVVGVMKDFNFWSLHAKVGGYLVWINNPRYGLWPTVIAHTNTPNYRQLVAKIEQIWRKDVPGVPFEYTFMDEYVGRIYETDITVSRIINSFTLMAVVISCLGLFGLAAFSAEQRGKEVSIRKVLGASAVGLARLLSMEFVRLVGIAFLIATPVAWWVTSRWLQTFAFRISLRWWMFGLAGMLALGLALATVSYHAIRAALANPVKSLRSE
ncbi:MAG TPA: ABC transporter permease [Puia sp.]|jgi:putative ABC transport system permease protein|nr:ABC transporter permease [Puia sp.]